ASRGQGHERDGPTSSEILIVPGSRYICIAGDDQILAGRLEQELEDRLKRVAAKTGRTKTFYAREAIEAHLDDLEDFFLAEERLRGFRSEDAIPLAEVEKRLGLDD